MYIIRFIGLLSSLCAGLHSSYSNHSVHATSALRKWRVKRSSSTATAMALCGSASAASLTLPMAGAPVPAPVPASVPPPASPVRPGRKGSMSTAEEEGSDCAFAADKDKDKEDLDQARMELVSQMLTIMQKGQAGKYSGGDSMFANAAGVFRTLYSMIFGSVEEEISGTTQYSSLCSDIALLEAPDFEVSLERKITTATRMRVSYHCLVPSK